LFVCLHIDISLDTIQRRFLQIQRQFLQLRTVRGYPLISDHDLAQPMAELGLGQLITSGPITGLDSSWMKLKDNFCIFNPAPIFTDPAPLFPAQV
jgi:hypothetical protein